MPLSVAPIKVPGLTDLKVIHYNHRSSLMIQRGHRVDHPEETVVCKANAFFDEDENLKLKHEFELLNLIHVTLNDIVATRKQGASTTGASVDSKSGSGGSTTTGGGGKVVGAAARTSNPPLPSVSEESTSPSSPVTTPPLPIPEMETSPPKTQNRTDSGNGSGSNTITTSTTSITPKPSQGRPSRRPRSTSLSHDSIQGSLTDRIIRPLSLEDFNGQFILILEDYGALSLREFAIGTPKRSSPVVSPTSISTSPEPLAPVKAVSTALVGGSDLGTGIGGSVAGTSDSPVVVAPPAPGTPEKTPRKGTRQLPLEEFLHIATQLAEALEIVHAAQVMHKDINPDNIVIKRLANNQVGVQLIDFNLAEVTDMGSQGQRNYLEGTLAYLSPEQTGRMQRVVDYRTGEEKARVESVTSETMEV
ncbi:hypothetical protein HKX48_005959 [Thoreauomyces humboldtii]|nr:hypothetical protein HKX48_005959 [Thoreauomyces humboldtii]